MKTALLAASLVLVAGTTVGCAGGPPTDASTADFCGTFDDFNASAMDLGEDPDPADVVEALKDVATELEEVGTPEDIPEDARAGFELVVETIQELPEDASQEDIAELDKDFTDEQNDQSDAFDDYLSETCSESGDSGEPGDSETEQ